MNTLHHEQSQTAQEVISILIVDDDEINQEITKNLLTEKGYHVCIANDGLEAIEKIKSSLFHIILMDISMPRLDGITTTTIIREELNLIHIPIIAMTAHHLPGSHQAYFRAGINDILIKPFDFDHLYSILTKWVTPMDPSLHEIQSGSPPLKKFKDFYAYRLPGLDIYKGLYHTHFKKDKYIEILHLFNKKYSNFHKDLDQAIELGNYNDIKPKIHALKGVSGTIGATSLFQYCIDFEKSMLDHQSIASDWLRCKDELSIVLRSVSTIVQEFNEEHLQKINFPISQQAILEKIKDLESHLNSGSFYAESVIIDLAQYFKPLADSPLKQAFAHIYEEILQFNYDEAKMNIEKFKQLIETAW